MSWRDILDLAESTAVTGFVKEVLTAVLVALRSVVRTVRLKVQPLSAEAQTEAEPERWPPELTQAQYYAMWNWVDGRKIRGKVHPEDYTRFAVWEGSYPNPSGLHAGSAEEAWQQYRRRLRDLPAPELLPGDVAKYSKRAEQMTGALQPGESLRWADAINAVAEIEEP